MQRFAAHRSEDGVNAQASLSLAALLGQQVEAVKALVGAVSEKRDAIVARDVKGVERAVAHEQSLLGVVEALEAQRMTWVHRWQSTSSWSAGEETAPTLSDIASTLPADEAKAVREAADRLEAALVDLRQANQQNADLLFQAIAFTRTMIDAVTGVDAKAETYGPGSARGGSEAARPLVEWRA